jgi:hypothetical protein
MKVLNLNQEFPEGFAKGRPMQGARAVRCLPAAPALPRRIVHGGRARVLAGEGRF